MMRTCSWPVAFVASRLASSHLMFSAVVAFSPSTAAREKTAGSKQIAKRSPAGSITTFRHASRISQTALPSSCPSRSDQLLTVEEFLTGSYRRKAPGRSHQPRGGYRGTPSPSQEKRSRGGAKAQYLFARHELPTT